MDVWISLTASLIGLILFMVDANGSVESPDLPEPGLVLRSGRGGNGCADDCAGSDGIDGNIYCRPLSLDGRYYLQSLPMDLPMLLDLPILVDFLPVIALPLPMLGVLVEAP